MGNIEMGKIWRDQLKFELNFFDPSKMTIEEKQKMSKEMALCIHSEVDEFLKNMNWKQHRNEKIRVIESNLIEEIIDIFKYWMSLAQVWEFDIKDIEREYWRKTEVVNQRFYQEKKLNLAEAKKIVAIDIDGVLADYPKCFIEFVNKKKKTSFANLFELKKEMTTKDIEEMKHEYRSCGVKAHLPIIYGAPKFTRELKKAGFTIILTSARPYKVYNRIYSDTLIWLKKNNIMYDYIVWDSEKHLQAIKNYPKMMFMIEDDARYANQVGECGYPVYLLSTIYNKFNELHQNVKRVNSFHEILEMEGIANERRNAARQSSNSNRVLQAKSEDRDRPKSHKKARDSNKRK